MSSRTHILTAGAILFAMSASPITASAQQVLQPVRVTAEVDRAEEVAASAFAVAATPAQFVKAGRLYERAAKARETLDPMRAVALRKAAVSYYYGRDVMKSVALMEQSAQGAVEFGDVVGAANSYIDAAFIARSLRQEDRARSFEHRAKALTASPLLSDAQRTALRTRLNAGTNVAIAM